jgi:putative transposase
MIDTTVELSIERQCELLGKSRNWYYYENKKNNEKIFFDNLYIEHIIDINYLYPFYGYRKIHAEIRRNFFPDISLKCVYRLTRAFGIHAIYPGINLSKARQDHKKYPYLLKNLAIVRPNQVWQMDITYIKLPRGFVYLAAIIDVFTRRILSWNISNTIDTELCLFCLASAFESYGKPEIFNTDQGCQFTSQKFIDVLEKKEIAISMDSKGRALDNIYIERFWRSVKYEHIFLMSYTNFKQLKKGLEEYMDFYNNKRVHQSLNYCTPSEFYNQYQNELNKKVS